jgi:hypothetical protein
VVTELSGLSTHLPSALKAHTAILDLLERGLVQMYSCKGSRIRSGFDSVFEEWGEFMTADDVIVAVCVGVSGVLCTGDGNMRIKASGFGVLVIDRIGGL